MSLNYLYQSVQKNVGLKTKFRNAYKKFYKAKFNEAPTKYDFSRELVNVKTEHTIDEAKELVINAFKPFGDEYLDVVKNGFNEN